LNDVIRYWRTVAVDYATKKWKHGTSGWALRNIKLRMSRKLLFTKGLLACFDCGLHPHEPNMPKNPSPDIVAVCLQERVYSLCRMTPIDILCQSLSKHSTPDISTKILSAYNAFLHTLDNQQSRKALEDLGPETAHKDTVFEQMRSTSHEFGDQLEHFFFDGDPQLRTITKKYGVF
jgi:hypothetical protein